MLHLINCTSLKQRIRSFKHDHVLIDTAKEANTIIKKTELYLVLAELKEGASFYCWTKLNVDLIFLLKESAATLDMEKFGGASDGKDRTPVVDVNKQLELALMNEVSNRLVMVGAAGDHDKQSRFTGSTSTAEVSSIELRSSPEILLTTPESAASLNLQDQPKSQEPPNLIVGEEVVQPPGVIKSNDFDDVMDSEEDILAFQRGSRRANLRPGLSVDAPKVVEPDDLGDTMDSEEEILAFQRGSRRSSLVPGFSLDVDDSTFKDFAVSRSASRRSAVDYGPLQLEEDVKKLNAARKSAPTQGEKPRADSHDGEADEESDESSGDSDVSVPSVMDFSAKTSKRGGSLPAESSNEMPDINVELRRLAQRYHRSQRQESMVSHETSTKRSSVSVTSSSLKSRKSTNEAVNKSRPTSPTSPTSSKSGEKSRYADYMFD